MLTLRDPLQHARRQHRERVAVIDGDTRFDHAQLASRCAQLGAGLRALGLQRGDRVAVLADNGHRYLEAFCGIPAAAMVIVPLNTRLATAELRDIALDCEARVLLTDRAAGELGACFEHVIAMPDDYEALLTGDGRDFGPAEIAEDDLAALFYTGGTTGRPKGVMLSHRNLLANAFQKALACSLGGDDAFLAAPAMFHVAGIAPLLSLIWLGGRVITLPSFDPDATLDLIARHDATVVMPVPTMLAAMVRAQRHKPRELLSLRMIGHAGSSITEDAIEQAHATFPDAELAQFYGATETASLVTCQRHEERLIGTPQLGTCGRAAMGVDVRVLREDGSECEPGEVGEIVIRGANVSGGYWRQPQVSAEALRGGGYHSGDLGRLDIDGHLYVVDRMKDMIITGGENVYSSEVESVLHRYAGVLEAAVIGLPDEKWGERVHAIVVVDPRATLPHDGWEAELRAHCRASIAGYKVPKTIELQHEPLPKSGPGKILKRVLRAARLE